MKKNLLAQVLGAVFAILFGAFLHFAYALSNYIKPVVLIAAVNESVWEHLKIAFWPIFIFGVFEYFYYGRSQKSFFIAKAINLYSAPILIIVLFYGYTFFIKDNLFFDISIFIIAIIVSYAFSYKALVSRKNYKNLTSFSIVMIVFTVLLFSIFTYFAPHSFLFKDPVTLQYGVIK
jgi:hypothetical protein